MIEFIDIERGTSYDARQPYTQFIVEHGSIATQHTRRLMFVTDTSTARVTIDASSPFTIVDASKLIDASKIDYEQHTYFDITKITTHDITLSGTPYPNTPYYVYSINIICQFDDAGEFVDTMTINNVAFNIGANVYACEENLGTLIANAHGRDIVDTIERALYDSNVRNETTNNVTMNRKRRELLLNYMSTFANVGSYGSLISSLAWFEYGELVTLCEYWRNAYGIERDALFARALSNDMNDDIRSLIQHASKTSFIGINCAMQSLTNDNEYYDVTSMLDDVDTHATIVEDIAPRVVDVVTKWTREDMALKMRLVEMFYPATFMPIHLALLHATCDDIVFNESIKMLFAPRHHVACEHNDIRSFDSTLRRYSSFAMNDVVTRATSTTRFVQQFDKNVVDYDAYRFIVGVERTSTSNDNVRVLTNYDASTFVTSLRRTSGVIVDVVDTIHTSNNAIQRVDIVVYRLINNTFQRVINERDVVRYDVIEPDAKTGVCTNAYALCFANVGTYCITMTYHDLASHTYTRSSIVRVALPRTIACDVYALKRLNVNDVTSRFDDDALFDTNANYHVTSHDAQYDDFDARERATMNVLCLSNNAFNVVGMSHIVHFAINRATTQAFKIAYTSNGVVEISRKFKSNEFSHIASTLNNDANFNHYRYIQYEVDNVVYVTCIRRFYDDDDVEKTSYKFKHNNVLYTIDFERHAIEYTNVNASKLNDVVLHCDDDDAFTYTLSGDALQRDTSCRVSSQSKTKQLIVRDASNDEIVASFDISFERLLNERASNDFKIDVRDINKNNTFVRYINASRFIAMFHDCVKMNDDERLNVSRDNAIIYVRFSNRFVRAYANDAIVTFDNRSSHDASFACDEHTMPMFARSINDIYTQNASTSLSSGYYDIVASFAFDDVVYKNRYDSMFRILK